jgi:peptidoglycan/LPS O-acetylase OafA/YrhL
MYLGMNLPDNIWQYIFFVQNFSSEMLSFFIESWSLSIEEFAYLIGPLLLFLALFIKTKASKSKLFLVMTLFVIIFFTVSKIIYSFNDDIKNMIHWNSSLKAVVIYRIDAIYYGVFAAYISIEKNNFWKRIKYVLFVLGVIFFLGLNAIIPLKQVFIETHTMFWNVWYLPINSIAIMLTLPLLSQIQSASKLILKPIIYISLISYAMYVLHYSIILQLLKYFIPSEGLPKFDVWFIL